MKPLSEYVGTPWEAGAQGPSAFDCMAFFRHVQMEHFGVNVAQVIAPDFEDAQVLTDLFARHPERETWESIPRPEHGCAVLIRKPLHIGVWLDIDGGGVLHCVRGVGVIYTHDASWPTSGFGRKEHFRKKS